MSGPSSFSAADAGSPPPPSGLPSEPRPAVVVRAADAETLTTAGATVRLLADSSTTGGALSTQRVALAEGADGAVPHTHRLSSELFYVLSGSVDVLTGDRVLTGTQGDLVVVPPNLPHAFAATPGHAAELLIVITPGIERFDYFRHLSRIAHGEQPAESLLELQEHYDTHFLVSPPWRAARAR